MYDVFISFKNLDRSGKPTRDSVLAREVFDRLSSRGFRVFFSPVSLEKLGVSAYKAAIDKALDASRILVAVGTSTENLDTQWVRYEWDGFFNDILSGVKPDGRVFVYVEGCEPRCLPRALRQSQVFAHADGGLEKLAHFVANALPDAFDRWSAASETAAVIEPQAEMRPAEAATSVAGPLRFAYQKDLTERYGPAAVGLAELYPFLKRHWGVCDQERIYRTTGRRGPSGDLEVACRICGNRQEWDRYPSLELPKVCPDCAFEGDFSARVFVAYAHADSALADVLISELERAQFRIKRSRVTKTVGGWLDIERLSTELKLCKACVCLWSNRSEEDTDLASELIAVRDLALPTLFAKVEKADPQPRPDTERVLDLNGPGIWDAVIVDTLSDCLTVDEKRRRESRG
ncbi:MAG: toll/interleukin-1 receptor domain-containing protein [Planctomycetaceae bacterium]|nr:toll/interleukin-1 receptor domain-containing protein [Planctomycetaceae bacterium]